MRRESCCTRLDNFREQVRSYGLCKRMHLGAYASLCKTKLFLATCFLVLKKIFFKHGVLDGLWLFVE